GDVWREHRTHLILFSINPSGEKHLEGSAAIPVPLLKIRANASYARPKSLRNHGCKRWIPQCSNSQLPFGRRRAPNRPDLAVRPGLGGHPRDRIDAICERSTENVIVAF